MHPYQHHNIPQPSNRGIEQVGASEYMCARKTVGVEIYPFRKGAHFDDTRWLWWYNTTLPHISVRVISVHMRIVFFAVVAGIAEIMITCLLFFSQEAVELNPGTYEVITTGCVLSSLKDAKVLVRFCNAFNGPRCSAVCNCCE